MSKEGFKSGFVALIGRPNVGKSTLLNYILGQKISIVSDKAQTTRNRLLGVYTAPAGQIVFVDTPGVHKPKHKLGEWMRKESLEAMKEVDAIVFMTAADEGLGKGEEYILDLLRAEDVPVYLVINKIDKVEPEKLLPKIKEYSEFFDFREVIPVSAQNGANVRDLLQVLYHALPEGPQYFPEDMVTDRPERNIIAEIIREKLLHLTREEIPHALAIDVEEIGKRANGTNYVRAVIMVERDSQKRIVIGKKGSVLREAGAAARQDIQILLGGPVYLDLWVKVVPDWRNRDRNLKELGYE